MTSEEIIDQAKDLPVVSETVRRLTIQLNQTDLHRDELAKTIRSDGVLTAKLLRVCNSAFCGVPEQVVSVDQAVSILGDRAVFRMVSAIGFGEALGWSAPAYETEANGLWAHSLSTGIGAEYACKMEFQRDFLPSAAFTAGLLHDIGKSVMNKVLTPKARAEIRNKIFHESLSRFAAEKAVLGANHSEIGACLLQRWSLPEIIIEAVANHHSPATKPALKLSAVVYLANGVALLSGTAPGWETRLSEANHANAELFGMDVNKMERLVSGIQNEINASPQF